MLNDGTEAILNFALYPVIFEKNLMEASDFLINERVIPLLKDGTLNKENLLTCLKDAISKNGWKDECGASAAIRHSEESIKSLLIEILKQVETN